MSKATHQAVMLTPQARNMMAQYLKALVANTIRQGFAAIPEASAGWPIDDKIYNQFISLIIDQAAFLKKVNVVSGFDTTIGNILRYNLTGHVLKRTVVDDTVRRMPTIAGGATPQQYTLLPAEADAYFPYNDLNHWAKMGPDALASKIREMIAIAIANDLLWVGFHGEADDAAPAEADLSDFSIGWLQLLRAYDGGANFMDEVVATSGIITVGEAKILHFDAAAAVTSDAGAKAKLKITNHGLPVGMRVFIAGTTNYNGIFLVEDAGDANYIKIAKAYNAENLTAAMTCTLVPDYASLDSLAADLRNTIPQELRTGIEVVMSDDLRASEEEAVYGAFGRTPSEKAAIIAALSNVAGLTPNYVTPMPAGTMIVTPPQNLAIYMHENITRRVEDKPELNGFVFWNTFGGVDYIVTDYRRMMAAENIHIIK